MQVPSDTSLASAMRGGAGQPTVRVMSEDGEHATEGAGGHPAQPPPNMFSDEKFFEDFDFLDELVTPDVIADTGATPARDRVVSLKPFFR